MKVYIKSLLKLIKSNLSRFITLALIVFLGIGFLVGVFSVAPDLYDLVNEYLIDNNVSELYNVSTTGFYDDDIDNIKAIYNDDVEIRKTYEEDVYLTVNNLTRVGKMIYLDFNSNSDKLTLVKGSLPTNSNEVVVEQSGNYLMNIEVGSTIKYDNKEYVVSGVVSNPWYIIKERYDSQTLNASLDTVVYLPLSYYLDSLEEYDRAIYTNLYLYFGTNTGIYDNDFEDETAELIKVLEDSNFESNHNQLFKENLIDEAFINLVEEVYNSILNSPFPSMVENVDLDKEIDDYYNGEEFNLLMINTTREALYNEFIEESGSIYELDISSYLEGETTFGSLVNKTYDEYDKEIYYLNSLDSYAFYFYQMNVEKVEDVAVIFPIFFFIIASLVALTSLRRLVFEERVTIGTLRGLGYSKTAVMMRYIIYGVLASGIGSVLGIAFGIAMIPYVIYNIFFTTTHMPPLIYGYDTPFITTVVLVMILVIILVVVFSVISTLKESPASLLIPKAPKPGHRIILEKITFIWKRLKFKYKAAIRNMIRYKRNLIMMIIGVGGCSALLLLAFALSDSMDAVSNRQFDTIVTYDAIAVPERDITSIDNSHITNQDRIYFANMEIDEYTIHVIGANEDINTYFDFYVDNKLTNFTSDDVYVSKLFAKEYDLEVGSTIKYDNIDYTITGVFENYIDNYLFIGTNKLDKDYNRIILNYEGVSERDFTDELLSSNQIISISYISSTADAYSSLVNNIILIVVVLIVFAAILAVVVIFNLMNINVSERRRELATLKVLGYKDLEVHGYIARETFILTIIGMLIGLGLGVLLHQFIAGVIDTNTLMAGRYIKWQSYVYTILLTMGFTLIVDLCFIPHYHNISMTESLKAIE